jgi:flagellar hook-associated protein 1
MTSILSGLDTVQQSLAAQQFAMSITQRNVANANDPGYTRQQAVFTPVGSDINSGVSGVQIQSSRSRFLDYSICKDLQSLGEHSIAYDALQQVDSTLGGNDGASLQQALSNFFTSFTSLSSAPEDMVQRQKVLSMANNLAAEFQRLYGSIQQVQISEDQAVTSTVDDINSITAKIADLNMTIPVARQSHDDSEFTLRDNRQQLLEQLSSLMDVSYYENESGSVTVTTRDGAALVLGDQSHLLKTTRAAGETYQSIQLDGADITPSLRSGQLGSLINVRDNIIGGYLSTLDDMARIVIDRVNDQHSNGDDLDGNGGLAFFTPFTEIITGSNFGAAMNMSVELTDPRKVAAAGSGAGLGDNANAKKLAGIADEALFSTASETISQHYAGLIYQVGSDEKTAEDAKTTQNDILEQLKNQRDTSFGVNMDEEAVNLVKYQKAYQASSRYANVLNTLSDEVLQILGS